MAEIGYQSGLVIPGASAVWSPLVESDFVSAGAADFDPVGVITNDLTFGATPGDINFDTTENGSASGFLSTAGIFLLNHMDDWLGDGTQTYAWRIWVVTHPSINGDLGVGLGMSDQNGEPAVAGSHGCGWGITMNKSVTDRVQMYRITRASNAIVGTQIVSATDVHVLGRYMPHGKVGDETNVGAQTGYLGSYCGFFRHGAVIDTSNANYDFSGTVIDEGFYQLMWIGWPTTGAEHAIGTVHIERCITPMFPAGEYG